MRTLVIVESPNKVKTIKNYLGNNYLVSASVGHVRDLKKKDLAVDVNNNFKESFAVLEDKVNIVKHLKDLSKKADMILLATDPDREGEAIAWHLYHLLKSSNSNIKRVSFNEITKTAILNNINNHRDIDYSLVDAQRTRRILDRLVGFQVSGLLQKKVENNLSAGRVQSAVVRVIHDRDLAIKNFTPEEYWTITAELEKDNNEKLTANLIKKGPDRVRITNEQDYLNLKNELKNEDFLVDKIEKKVEKRKPQAPLITSSLQKQSYGLFKYDSDTTMRIAQQLFEGIEVNGDRGGLITYMRTDSTAVSEDFQKETLTFIKDKYGNKYTPDKANNFGKKSNAQEAHECIRPTNINYEPDSIKDKLTKQQYDVYSLIYHRFLRSQMSFAEFNTVTIDIKAKDYTFSEKGSILKFDGFLIHDHLNKSNSTNKLLPDLNEGEVLNCNNLLGEQKFTNPPPLFDEGSLIEELEKLGIGRPSTYASIIKTIKRRGYVVNIVKNKRDYFDITDLGQQVVNDLINYFTNLFNLDYTKQMEGFLDDIASSKKDYLDVLNEFYDGFKKELDYAFENMPVTKKLNYHSKPCPKCSKKLIVKKGKYGEYVECEMHPNCSFRATKSSLEAETSNIDCPFCMNHKLVKRKGKYGNFYLCESQNCSPIPYFEKKDLRKDPCENCGGIMLLQSFKGSKYYSCINRFNKGEDGKQQPPCNNTKPFIDPKNTKKCPKCGKPMIKRKGQYGQFWACTGYPGCKETESIK